MFPQHPTARRRTRRASDGSASRPNSPRLALVPGIGWIIVTLAAKLKLEARKGAPPVATDERVPPKTGLLATVSVVALIGWGVAGYAFWSGSNELHATAAQLQQVEVA